MASNGGGPVRMRITVTGIVQGVGFRPHVHRLAVSLGLAGWVRNDAAGVHLEVEGNAEAVSAFADRLVGQAPPLAVVDTVTTTVLAPSGRPGFAIVDSHGGGPRSTAVSADVATCEDCLRELWDPRDRRFRYPFVNCTNCGPRFTIVRGVPYDRPATTMADFVLCDACEREYRDPANRRFHAQPVCCPACGPRLRLVDRDGVETDGDPLAGAMRILRAGLVLAVKGLGGFHLAVDAARGTAVAALRSRKHREERPFAVMAPDLAWVEEHCYVEDTGRALLTGPQRPIVLLERRSGAAVAEAVAPGNRDLGVLLPYTPLHHLLAADFGGPFVLTSGNVSDEPIVYRDDEASGRLNGIADFFLTHDRPIHTRVDDSVMRVFGGVEYPIRRSRGYAPQPITLRDPVPEPILACGAELKNTFCLAAGRRAFVSHHIGDLSDYETLRSFVEGVRHYSRLFDISAHVVAHDLHPEYLSTKYAHELDAVRLVPVQHHHAHIASCLADNGEAGPVIGVAFDGTGYGADGTLWGGEFLLADLAGYHRIGHLAPVPLPGGEAAIRAPWRMAAAYLDVAFDGAPPRDLAVVRRAADAWELVVRMARSGLNSPMTSGMGRLFDAVAALVGVRDTVTYEGQAAIELEQRVDRAETAAYPVAVDADGVFDGAAVVRSAAEDLMAGYSVPTIAARFHNTVADLVVLGCVRSREEHGVSSVALSGGVFQNVVLLTAAAHRLRAKGFKVLTHRRVPANDGGISLGQAAVAAARASGQRTLAEQLPDPA